MQRLPPRSQKKSKCDRVSSVPPDFDETTKRVRPRSSESASRRIARRMRRVEDVEALTRERAAQDLGREARPAHSEQDDVVGVGRGFGQLTQLAEPLPHPQRLVEPPEPLGLVLAGPDGRVALPDALDELAGLDHGDPAAPWVDRPAVTSLGDVFVKR